MSHGTSGNFLTLIYSNMQQFKPNQTNQAKSHQNPTKQNPTQQQQNKRPNKNKKPNAEVTQEMPVNKFVSHLVASN